MFSSLFRWRKHVPHIVWLALALQTVYFVAFAASDAYDAARTGEVVRVVCTYITVTALFGLTSVDRARWSRVVTSILWTAFILVNFARFETTGAFDYTFVHENVRELATPFGRNLVSAQVRPWEIVVLCVVPVIAGLVVIWRYPGRASWSKSARRRFTAASAAIAIGVPMTGIHTHESLSIFVLSAVRHFGEARRIDSALDGAPYPFVRDFVPSDRARALAGDGPRPHVLLLFLESWSAIYTNRNDAEGRPFTPAFDAWARDSLTFDSFYGSSVQSSHGRFATLCSLVPLYRGKEADVLADAGLHCLPEVLNEAGYRTIIDSAADEPAFERSEVFFKKIGFSKVRFEDPARRATDPRVWGVGVQDDTFYEEFFARLDEEVARDPSKPLFAVAINASNHYPFNKNPRQVPAAGYPTKYARNYIASLRAADGWLPTFFAELDRRPAFRDAIVVLVGDHSFPADEHGVHFNGLGAREESFRTSLALRWRGHITPKVVSGRAASQLDVAPTITDLLLVPHRTHFRGRSLVADEHDDRPVPMVQPYDGVRLVAVRPPLKLEVHVTAGQQHLYDLSSDPDEERDLFGRPDLAAQTTLLGETIEEIRRSQAVLRAKRVWPR